MNADDIDRHERLVIEARLTVQTNRDGLAENVPAEIAVLA